MGYENVIVEQDGNIGIITLNRPEVLNAFSRALQQELDAVVGDMENNPEISAIIFTGSGNQAFSAGADPQEISGQANESAAKSPDPESARYAWHIAACSKPTIGAINGLAYGVSTALASSFDIRVGCENSSFKFLAASYARVNSTWSLPMQVGWPIAKELLFTARVVDAKEAFRIGLLNHLVSADQLMLKVTELAKQIATNDPRLVQEMKELIVKRVSADWEQMCGNEPEV